MADREKKKEEQKYIQGVQLEKGLAEKKSKKKTWIMIVVALLVIGAAGCAMDSDVQLESKLSEKLKSEYEFYEDSIDEIKNTMKLSQEEADNVFSFLVTECGIDEKIQYVFKHGINNDDVYDIWSGWKHLVVTMTGSGIQKVQQGSEQIYPAVDKAETETNETKTDEPKRLSDYELISMDGHPVLYDYISDAHDFWDDYADGRINFDDIYFNNESGDCVLSMTTYEVLERNQKEHMIRSFEINLKEKMSIKKLLKLAKSYLPINILKKWYSLKLCECYYEKKSDSYIYTILYEPTENGKKAIKKQNLDYNYAMVIIQMGNEIMPSISICSTYSMPDIDDDYKQVEWKYDFVD